MASPGPVQVVDLTVALEYAIFYLSGDPLPAAAAALPAVVTRRSRARGSPAPGGTSTWWSSPPTGLVVGPGGLVFESPTAETHIVPVPPGRYAARVAGRGFVTRGWPGSTTPGDEWRLQLWPATRKIPPRRLRSWTPPAATT